MVTVKSAQVDLFLGPHHQTTAEVELFKEIKDKLTTLRRLSEVDELFIILIQCYWEFESERNKLRNSFQMFGSQQRLTESFRAMNICLMSVLTWSRCFFDIGSTHFSDQGFPKRHVLKTNNFSFLLIEHIRNKSQHNMLPIHGVGYTNDPRKSLLNQSAPEYSFSKERIAQLPIHNNNPHEIADKAKILAREECNFNVSFHLLTYIQTIRPEFISFRQKMADYRTASCKWLLDILDGFHELHHDGVIIFTDEENCSDLVLSKHEIENLEQSNQDLSTYLEYAMKSFPSA
ncbi:hypothetical protein [Celeribacter naphthalenivorans]|uniref:hypothetical protein n=1 Tax=Celeribacter naphthalenivorans TaxID=1614694 RepID=UPI001CFAB058|nr:hypothetical protein [Celeribacter naphthalenivorans]